MQRYVRAHRAALFLLLTAGGAFVREGHAQPPSEASITAARALGEEGLSLFDAGKYEAALERFEKADVVLKAPTLDLYAARCLVKLQKLADAQARYEHVLAAQVNASSPPAFKQAQIDAGKELAELRPRVPKLSIVLKGDTSNAIITIDGQPAELASLTEKKPLNPGAHRVEAKRGNASVEQEVVLGEGDEKTAVLVLPEAPSQNAEPGDQHFMDPGLQRTLGFAGLGVGGAGLLLWGITGGLALGQTSDLKAIGCENGHCPPGSSPGSYAPLRTASAIGFYAGIVGAAAGAVLLLTLPRKRGADQSNQNAIQLWISPSQAGFSGHF